MSESTKGTPHERENPTLLILAASFFFTGLGVCIKAASGRLPLYEIVFFRSIITVLILGWMMRRQGISFRAENLPLLLTRSLSGFLAMSCNFYALAHLSLGDCSMLVNTFPVFVVLLSFLFLGEKPSRTLIALILTAVIGIVLILRPQLDILNYAGLIALLAAVFSSVVVIVVHQSHETDPSLRIALYFTATCAFIALPIMTQGFLVPHPREALLLLGAGLFGTGGQITMTRAYRHEDVSSLSPLAYTGVVLSFLAGIVFWGEIPTAWSLVGSLIVIGVCVQLVRIKRATALRATALPT